MKLRIGLKSLLATFLFSSAVWGGDVEEARRLYDLTDYHGSIAKLGSASDAVSLTLLGQNYYRTEDLRRATESLEKAVALNPSRSNAYLWLGRVYGRRAEAAFPLAAPPLAVKARQNFERALQLNPKNWEAADDLFEYYVNAPVFLGGGLDKATRMASLIEAHDPAEAAFDRSRIAEERKQFAEAEAQLRRAIQLAPDRTGKMAALARFLAKRGRFEESDQVFQRALKMSPEKPETIYIRANTLVETNRNLLEARELLKKYISLNLGPDDPPRRSAQKLLRRVSGAQMSGS